jgi:peptidyl-dipeptidase Dcp
MNILENPLIQNWDTPHQTPPFSKIETAHFLPAFKYAIDLAEEEVNLIAFSKIKSSFQSVIVQLENAGQLLSQVSGVFYNLLSSNTSPELQALAKEIGPMMTEYSNKTTLNAALFAKIQQVYAKKEELNNEEDVMLLEKVYQNFIRSGAKLNEEEKEKYRELSMKLSKLSLEFGDNVLN